MRTVKPAAARAVRLAGASERPARALIQTTSVDSAIARLRKKIEPDPHRPLFIHTVHGDGYCLTSTACDGAEVGAMPPGKSPEERAR